MTLKRWLLGKVNGTPESNDGREAPGGSPAIDASRLPSDDGREPSLGPGGVRRAHEPAYLGPYGTLIGAIREELERFVETQLRLHLAIAEHDRYVLTSIEIDCEGGDEHRELLRRFVVEFRPEQIKHYIAREVIGGLRNASSIDLSQFAGLDVAAPPRGDDEGYDALVAELNRGLGQSAPPPYRVKLVGRWSQAGAAPTIPPAPRPASGGDPDALRGGHTPMAGRSLTLEIEDARGSRRVDLDAVVPGRRYVIGKDEHCDVVVDGVYTSRRHCEIWLEDGTVWVADAGSTNGIRVESSGLARTYARSRAADGGRAKPLPPGAWMVLSEHAEGEPRDYPRVSWAPSPVVRHRAASVDPARVTPIARPRRRAARLAIAAQTASGVRTAEIGNDALPFGIGRSRQQPLAIDWTHEEVSALHLEIVGIDESGASVVVHGDNGVAIDGRRHAPGARFVWKPGEKLLLGRAEGAASGCILTLARVE